jgi:hypothetical protein
LVALVSISCSSEKRLSRLLSKNPHLIETDTVFFRDTVIVPGVKNDTVFSLERILSSRDTIIIQKDRLTQKIYYTRDSIFISGECATDTIYKDNFRTIEKYTVFKRSWWEWLLILISSGIILIKLFKLFK